MKYFGVPVHSDKFTKNLCSLVVGILFDVHPNTNDSTRRIALDSRVSRMTIWRIWNIKWTHLLWTTVRRLSTLYWYLYLCTSWDRMAFFQLCSLVWWSYVPHQYKCQPSHGALDCKQPTPNVGNGQPSMLVLKYVLWVLWKNTIIFPHFFQDTLNDEVNYNFVLNVLPNWLMNVPLETRKDNLLHLLILFVIEALKF